MSSCANISILFSFIMILLFPGIQNIKINKSNLAFYPIVSHRDMAFKIFHIVDFSEIFKVMQYVRLNLIPTHSSNVNIISLQLIYRALWIRFILTIKRRNIQGSSGGECNKLAHTSRQRNFYSKILTNKIVLYTAFFNK